jgi:hypothetical protein
MARSRSGETVLVATTVIEVGVDVPEATIMVVEHAERFGLAQLHQLRGRVGRGSGQIDLPARLWHPPLGETAKARLKTLRETDDGFVIAEEDLRLRGAGELLGRAPERAAGIPLADLASMPSCLAAARDDAKLVLAATRSSNRPAAKLCACCSTFSNATKPCDICGRDEDDDPTISNPLSSMRSLKGIHGFAHMGAHDAAVRRREPGNLVVRRAVADHMLPLILRRSPGGAPRAPGTSAAIPCRSKPKRS